MADDRAAHPPPDGGVGSSVERLLRSECLALLGRASIGRLAFVVDGWPVVEPVNYAVDAEAVVFRTDPGAKLEGVTRSARVAFEVDSVDSLYESGWSVLVQGVAEAVGPEGRDRLATKLRLHPWAGGTRAHWVRIPILQVTGRRLPRSWVYPRPIPTQP